MVTEVEFDAMRRAIALSAFGLGSTAPNPPVGCVILDAQGNIAGQGYHQRKGEPHAEAHALAAAGGRADGGIAVVTLEPCNHQGRTPACHQALIDANIARVVIALVDPTSRGDGGVAKLRSAGVVVDVGVLAEEARLVLGPWLNSLGTGRAHVTWVYTVTGDGPAPALDSTSQILAADVQLLRIQNDAVLYADDHVEEGAPNSHGQGMLDLTRTPPRAGPPAVLAALHAGGVRSILINGDRRCGERFVQAGLVDQIVAYLAVEGSSTRPRSGGYDVSWSLLPPGFAIADIARLDTHVKITGIRTDKIE
ncbi:MAG: bifunctional diaminohydroxyphosphoribosylaminopyrimidine deaminase/5-amino-6-(5-phosphoribosylamino)uracil reductase RibD [Pseudonocardiaceae bacterium]